MNDDQESNKSNIVCESPQLELSVGIGRPWFEADGSIKKDKSGREKLLNLQKVAPWVGTPRELHALLNSHRNRATNAGFKYKVGHFIVGAVFSGTEKHPTGHRHGDNLQRATLVLFDIDDAPDLTRAELEARLRALDVGFIFYSTWSNARAGSGKTGLCARIIFWLTRPLTAPNDLPQALRVRSIGQQLAAIVRHLSARLEIDSTKAVDEVSKRPHQLMYTPRSHDAGRHGPDCWWCEFHNGPALNPDSLPGGVSLTDLLPPSVQQLTNANKSSAIPATPHPPSTSSKATPSTLKGFDDVLRARGLAYIEACAEDLKTFASGRHERITKHVGPRCGSIAAGHGLTKAEGLEPLEKIVSRWGRDDLTKALHSTFAHGYQDPRTLPDNNPPRSASKSSKHIATPNTNISSATSSPSSDAQSDTPLPNTYTENYPLSLEFFNEQPFPESAEERKQRENEKREEEISKIFKQLKAQSKALENPNDYRNTPEKRPMLLVYDCSNNTDTNPIDFLPQGKVGFFVAPGGTGKTQALIQLAVAVASGTKWFDTFYSPKGPARVLLALGEEDRAEFRRRINPLVDFICKKLEKSDQINGKRLASKLLADLQANLTELPLDGIKSRLIGPKSPRSGECTETSFFDALCRYVGITLDEHRQPKPTPGFLEGFSLIILDPASRFMGPDCETDNAAATSFIQCVEVLTRAPGTPTVLLAHHTGKLRSSGRSGKDAARGASALTDGARWSAQLIHEYDASGQSLGIKMHLDKTNYTRPIEPISIRFAEKNPWLERVNNARTSAQSAAANNKTQAFNEKTTHTNPADELDLPDELEGF